MTIALPHRVHNAHTNRVSRNTELDPGATYQRRSFARQPHRAPPIGDDARSDTHRNDLGGPAEPRQAQRDAGRGAAGPKRYDDCVGWRVELRVELERRKEVADHRSGIRAATRNPPRLSAPKIPRSSPRAQHCPRQCHHGRSANDQIGRAFRRRGNGATRLGLGLRKRRHRGAVPLRSCGPRRRHAVARSRPADRHEHRPRRRSGEQEFESSHLVAAGQVLPFQPQRRQSQRARERRQRLERRGPDAETARRESGAYLCGQHCGAIHASNHRLHTSCGASRPQMCRRSARGGPSGSRSRNLQDLSQGAGANRRGDGGTRETGGTAPGYIETPKQLGEFISAVRRESRVAVDTEAASFHRYRDRIYLLQVSSPTQTALIDPIALAASDLRPFGELLADPHLEKVFHDADYDLRVLDRDSGFHAVRLFDTRVAAQLAGEPAIGLAALLEKYAGVKLAKEHQKADWSLRPLTPPMLAYAAADTHYLLALRDAMEQRLQSLGRLSWEQEEFKHLESLRWTGVGRGPEADSYLRLKGAKGLAPRGL